MMHAAVALAAALGFALTGQAPAQQITTGGAGNTGIAAPRVTGGVRRGTVERTETIEDRNARAPMGNAASPSNSSVPGTTPGLNIGGTPTSGSPGTGGAAGGPSLSGQ